SFVSLAMLSLGAPRGASADQRVEHRQTATPVKHVIVLIGENRTFDHLFATYVPKSGDSVSNLLSKKIINADGSPGRNFAQAAQFQAVPPFRNKYFISLGKSERNWRLKPLTDRSRDNFPNPVSDRENPYV